MYLVLASFLWIYLKCTVLLLTAVDSSYKIVVSIVVCKELDDSVMKLGLLGPIIYITTYAQYFVLPQ